MLEVYLLGQFQVKLEGQIIPIASRPAQSLFAYLVLNPNMLHRRERLAGLLWPDAEDSSARAYLRQAIWKLHKAFNDCSFPWQPYLNVNEISIAFCTTCSYWFDGQELARKNSGPGWGVDELVWSVSCYLGDLLPGFYEEWVVLERERLRAAYDQKMGLLLEQLMGGAGWSDVIFWAERWLAMGQVQDLAYRSLLNAHAATSDQAGVEAVYRRCISAFARELGSEPPPDIRSTYLRARTQARQSPLPTSVSASVGLAVTGGDECAEMQHKAARRIRLLSLALVASLAFVLALILIFLLNSIL